MMEVGDRLGPYVVVKLIATGGAGAVYLARHRELGRLVALKVLVAGASISTDKLERFLREAQAGSRLSHPRICRVYDLLTSGQSPVLVLEYLQGPTLRQVSSDRAIPAAEVIGICADLAEGLAYLHRSGVIHGDLTPSNVIMTSQGPKLIDFGLARLVTERPPADGAVSNPASTPFVGTVPYLAPEGVSGQELDTRSDIFSLGVIFYELLTGRIPFRGRGRRVLAAAVLGAEPTPINLRDPRAQEVFDRFVSRCLSKDPLDRWQNAGDLAKELRWILQTPAANYDYRPVPTSPNPALRAILSASIVVATVVGWTLTRPNPRETPPPPDPPAAAVQVSLPEGVRLLDGPRQFLSVSPDGSK